MGCEGEGDRFNNWCLSDKKVNHPCKLSSLKMRFEQGDFQIGNMKCECLDDKTYKRHRTLSPQMVEHLITGKPEIEKYYNRLKQNAVARHSWWRYCPTDECQGKFIQVGKVASFDEMWNKQVQCSECKKNLCPDPKHFRGGQKPYCGDCHNGVCTLYVAPNAEVIRDGLVKAIHNGKGHRVLDCGIRPCPNCQTFQVKDKACAHIKGCSGCYSRKIHVGGSNPRKLHWCWVC